MGSDMDSDGYGYAGSARGIRRLQDDIREMGEFSVERAAAAWDRLSEQQRWVEFEAAWRQALGLIEHGGREEEWREVHREMTGLTEGSQALQTWREEHGEVGNKAERAAVAAALALMVEDQLDDSQAEVLLTPMGEVLPWLLDRG